MDNPGSNNLPGSARKSTATKETIVSVRSSPKSAKKPAYIAVASRIYGNNRAKTAE